jgi:hypothetical protein
MATSSGSYLDGDLLGQVGPLVAGIGVCTVLLTASFVGIVGLVSGAVEGLVGRLPLYVLTSSVAFVAVLVAADQRYRRGPRVLGRAVTAALVTFVVVSLGSEGIIYAVTGPEAVVASHLFVYLLSAAIIASGLGYWVVRHWQDLRALVDDGRLGATRR